MEIPDPPLPPRQYSPSFADLGVRAQAGRLIEVRTPDALGYRSSDGHPTQWTRCWLTPKAAEKLLAWLPDAIAEQARSDENGETT